MCAKLCENQTQTVGGKAILKKFDDDTLRQNAVKTDTTVTHTAVCP